MLADIDDIVTKVGPQQHAAPTSVPIDKQDFGADLWQEGATEGGGSGEEVRPIDDEEVGGGGEGVGRWGGRKITEAAEEEVPVSYTHLTLPTTPYV